MNTKQVRNNTEELLWDSIDALINELDQVAVEGVKLGFSAKDIADYITAETRTVKSHVLVGMPRDFDEIYKEFIDELIANGKYYEYEEFLKNTRLKYAKEA